MKPYLLPLLLTAAVFAGRSPAGEVNRPVIDFGDDYAWHGGLPLYRGHGPVQLFKDGWEGPCPVDVDGDGSTEDDSVAFYPFSLDQPLNPVGASYNDRGNNARFYGGLVSFFANKKPRWSEGGINIDHEGRDDFNLHSYATEGGDIGLQTFGLWLWQKEDFLNGGDQYPVRFNADSRLAVYISRYWKGYEEARFVVRDGGRFYISEHSFGGRQTLHWIHPLQTRWASYDPRAPYHIGFDAAEAEFASREFTDITAAGWWVAKPEVSPGALWLKWYAFGMDAVVDAPEETYRLPEEPVSYARWRRVFDRAARNQYALHPGYAFGQDGEPRPDGSGRFDPALPVAGITALDAAVWCNALSEQQGRTPRYYEDADHRYVLRRSIRRDDSEPPLPDRPFVKKDADGAAVSALSADGFVPAFGNKAAAFSKPWKTAVPSPPPPEPIQTPPLTAVPGGSYLRADEADVAIAPFEISETEITYTQWRGIRAWAEARGYRFDHPGVPGSLNRDLQPHRGTEPVADISQHDAMVWCNALSEYEGRTPVYYEDEQKSVVLRRASPLRFNQINRFRTDALRTGERPLATVSAPVPHLKWEADGYRLPTHDEWEYAARAGSQHAFPWGAERSDAHAWTARNANDRTHPAGKLKPNAFGLHDVIGNVYEWVWGGKSDYYDADNPRGDGTVTARGGSFRSGSTERDARELQLDRRPAHPLGRLFAGAAYPEIGFRVLRCAAGTHPAEAPPLKERVVLDVQPQDVDPLQGRAWRGNLARTGEFEGTPPGDAALRWRVETGGPVQSSPVVADGRVFVGSDDGRFYALDADSGERLWSLDGGGPVRGSALVLDRTVWIACPKGLFALDAETGAVRMHLPEGGKDLSPAAAGGLVFWQRPWRPLLGIDTETGEVQWKHRDWRGVGGGISSPALSGTTIAWCNGSPGTSVANLRTERLLWRYNGAADSHVYTPAIRDGGLIVVGQHGVSEADLQTGELRWSFRQPAWDNRHPKFSSPAVDADRVYVGHKDGHLYAINRSDGTEAWRFKTGGQVYSSPALAADQVVVGSADGMVYSLDRADGAVRWRFETGGPVVSSPAVAGQTVYVGSDDGTLYAIGR